MNRIVGEVLCFIANALIGAFVLIMVYEAMH